MTLGGGELKIFSDILTLQPPRPRELDEIYGDNEVLRSVSLPKLCKADRNLAISRLKDTESPSNVLNDCNYKFSFSEAVLNEITTQKSDNPDIIHYFTAVALHSYVAWHCEGHQKGAKLIITALVSLNRWTELVRQVLRSIFAQVLDTGEISEVSNEFIELARRDRCEDLASSVYIALQKRLDTNCFCKFVTDLTDVVVADNGWDFGEKNLEMILSSTKTLIEQVNSIVFRFLSAEIGMTRHTWEIVLEWLCPALLERIRKSPPFIVERSDDIPTNYTMIRALKTYMDFTDVETLPGGFDPSTSVEFPQALSLTKLFDGEVQRCIFILRNMVMTSDMRVEILLPYLFKWADSLSKDPYYYAVLGLILCVSSDEVVRPAMLADVNPSVLELFVHPAIFDSRMSVFNKNIDFSLINTYRAICLDCVLCGSGEVINRTLGYFLATSPVVLAETLFRLSNVSVLFASKIQSDVRIIKTLINLTMFYQHLEINAKQDHENIRTARVALFVLLAHLFSNSGTISMFFDDILFANSFISFIFETSLRHFVLQTLSTYLGMVDLRKATFLPELLLGIINIVHLRLPGQNQLMLLYDLVACLNESFAYHQKGVDQFGDFCIVLCECMAKLSSDELSRRVFDISVSFFALMSPYFTISPLEINALISGLTTFEDPAFLTSLYNKFISLLAGQQVTSTSPTFIVRQPQVLKLFIQALFETPRLKDMLNFILQLCKYSPRNLLACAKSDLELFVLRYLEKAKQTESLSNDVMQLLLEIYSLLSLPISSLQSVLRYISLMAPRDDGCISKYQNLFISNMNQMALNSANEPANSLALNGTEVIIRANPKFQQLGECFGFTFWLYIEPNTSSYRPRVCFFEFEEDEILIGCFVSNNSLLMFDVDEDIETTGIIYEGLEPHTWHFISVGFQVSAKRMFVQYSIDCNTRGILSFPPLSRVLDFTKSTFRIGGYCQDPADIPSRVGAVGVFSELKSSDMISLFELGPRNNGSLPVPLVVYVRDYSERLSKDNDCLVKDCGFMSVLTGQCGASALLPLFTQSQCKLSDGSDFCISLENLLTLLTHVLMYSLESQSLFCTHNGFGIIAHLLQEHWTNHFTLKEYLQLFQMLVMIQCEPLQEQLFDEVMTNFSFVMTLPAAMHLRIVKHWSQSLFSSFHGISRRCTSFEDLMMIIRLFYWYKPVESMFAKYQNVRAPDLDVRKCRNYLFSVLWEYVSDCFTESHFLCLVSHAIGCNEKEQVAEILAFINRIFSEKSHFVTFNIQTEAFEHMIHFYIRYPLEPIRLQVLEILITAHQVHLLSDEFVQKQLDRILFHFPRGCATESFFDWMEGVLVVEPRIFSLCCFLAILLKRYNFVRNIQPHKVLTVSNLWAITPLALCISSPSEYQEQIFSFLIDSTGDSLCNLYAQVEIMMYLVPNSAETLETGFFRVLCSRFNKCLPTTYQSVREFIAICKRVIFFGRHTSPFAEPEEKVPFVFDFDKFFENFKLCNITEPQFDFCMRLDENGKWVHHDLAKLCLHVLENPWCQKLSNFKLLLAAFLIRDGEDPELVKKYIEGLESEETAIAAQLVNYYLMLRKYKPMFKAPCNSSPLVDQAKFLFIVAQLKNEFYIECLRNSISVFREFQDKMAHDVDPARFDVSDTIVQSTEQMKQTLRRYRAQNNFNSVSWRKLWSSLSIVRGPWFNPDKSEQKKWVRDLSACFCLAPVKMRQVTSVIDTDLEPTVSGIFSYSVNIIDVRARQPGIISFQESDLTIAMDKKQFNIYYPLIHYVFRRQHHGIQIFAQTGRVFLLEFEEQHHVNRVVEFLRGKCSETARVFQTLPDQTAFMRQLRYTHSWRTGQISNYEYLLMVNHISGRSFHDVLQYPVMPWVLKDFSSDIDVKNINPNVLRDFSVKPSDDPLPQYAVISYLHAIEPFTSLENDTITEDMFSLDGYLNFAQKDKKICLELVPEFYSMPEVFMSPSFALPMWAHSSIDFVYRHRKVLESDLVSQKLHLWIDNVFGPSSKTFQCFDSPHPEKIPYSPEPVLEHLIEHDLECPSGGFSAVVISEDKPNMFHFWCYEPSSHISDFVINMKRAVASGMPMSTSIHTITPSQNDRQTTGEIPVTRSRSRSVRARLAGEVSGKSVIPKSSRKSVKQIDNVGHITTTGKSVLLLSPGVPILLDLVSGKANEFEIGTSRVTCVHSHGIWTVFGTENATLVLVRQLKLVYTVRLFREAVTACAVSSVFNIMVGGTKDSALILFSTTTRSLIKVLNIQGSDSRPIIPRKILITESWGFIIAYCTSIVAGTRKHYIVVYTVNGLLLHKTEIGFAVDFWYTWKSNKGFDYLVYASDTGQVYFSEVYYMDQGQMSLVNCRCPILSAHVCVTTSTLVIVTRQGRVTFLPIVMK